MGDSTSTAPSSGTWFQPISRAARGANAALRSGVTVKMALAMSSGWTLLAAAMARNSSCVASMMASGVFWLAVVAPRIPRQGMLSSCFVSDNKKSVELMLHAPGVR